MLDGLKKKTKRQFRSLIGILAKKVERKRGASL